jgi:arginine decarboxylase
VSDQDRAPIADRYDAFPPEGSPARPRPFMIPGHKLRTDLVGDVAAGDLSLWGHLAPMRDAAHVLVEAEELAAQLWGADWARFSVGGSSHGNQALALAVGRPGDEVVVTRAVHRSLLLGFVLAGLRPVWVAPPVDEVTGLPGRLPVDAVRVALADHPDARAVFAVEPGYAGTRSDVAGLAAAAHDAGVPLVVDQAWSAHFGFHPLLPPHALSAGADALVTSAHKSLPAFTQGALALASTERLDRDRLQRGFDATHTTSPAGPILASIDAARRLLATDGERLLGIAIDAVAAARERLARVDGLAVLAGSPDDADPLRLVVGLAGTGADGFVVEDDLLQAGFGLEMADRDTLVATVTLADDAESVEPLVDAVVASVEARRGAPRAVPAAAWLGTDLPEVAMPPREAFFTPHETVSADAAGGRVAAELVAPYPPGIPAIVPGEVVTAEVVEALRSAATAGVRVAYAADPTMATVQVVART